VPFDIIVVTFSLLAAVLGYFIIEKNIIERAQTRVKHDLDSAREVYQREVERVRDVVRFTAARYFIKDAIPEKDRETLRQELERIRKAESLDVLTLTDASGRVMTRSRSGSAGGDSQTGDELVKRVLSEKKVVAGTVIVAREELLKEGQALAEQAQIKFIDTPKAKRRDEAEETSGMMIKAGAPVLGYDGHLLGVLYGGRLLNRNYEIVDRVKDIVYKAETYRGRDIGTATIFQRDLRISTNVQTKDGNRAIGTRVSTEVNERVLVQGLPWVARAFVVNAWYKTAYEPIRDISGKIVGILYVGILEQPFTDMTRNVVLLFLGIIAIATALAASLELVVTRAILQPVGRMLKGTERLSAGELGYAVDAETGTTELNALAESFNVMSAQLLEREEKLKSANEELAELNKAYLDLIGFVSHELKGIVATTMMSTASVRDGIFGEINPKQEWALDSAIKNLGYLRETVRKFLDLSRIEKGELEVSKREVRLREDVFEACVETFSGEVSEKEMEVTNAIDSGIIVQGDPDLLRIVGNNLLGNAVKYGAEGGKVVLSSKDVGEKVQIEVYNDSRPIGEDEKARLFKKFSRLQGNEGKRVKGTGLGLFVTKEIVTKHGGEIWVEPRENGNSFIFTIEKGAGAEASRSDC